MAACIPEKGEAANTNPVPMRAIKADCLDPVPFEVLPGLHSRKEETMIPTTAANR